MTSRESQEVGLEFIYKGNYPPPWIVSDLQVETQVHVNDHESRILSLHTESSY